MKVSYVTFLSKGEPYDKGLSLGHLKESLVNMHKPYFDNVCVFTSEDVPMEYRKEYDPSIFETRFNPGYHNMGYGMFKPYLILKTLEETDCDVVLWRDGNIDKNPSIAYNVENSKELSLLVLNRLQTDIFVPFENPHWLIGNTTPSVVFETILGNVSSAYTQYPQMNAALIICKNTEYVKDFLRRWIELMKNKEFFYQDQPVKHPNYNMNCGDQGVLNVMLLKEIRDGRLPQGFPFIGYTERKFKLDSLHEIHNIPTLI